MKISTFAKTALLAATATVLTLGMSAPADAASGTMFGDPTAAAQWWRLQKYDDCVVMASADVVGQMTGKEPSEKAIIKVAQTTPSTVHPGSIYVKPANAKDPNSGQGTSFLDVPALLAHYGVDAKFTSKKNAAKTGVDTGMEALEQYLGSGRKVIVDVNAEMIWGQPIENKDSQGNPVGDHAVVVTGVDTASGVVHLNDSGNPKGKDEQIPMELFVKAWDAGDEILIVTTGTGK